MIIESVTIINIYYYYHNDNNSKYNNNDSKYNNNDDDNNNNNNNDNNNKTGHFLPPAPPSALTQPPHSRGHEATTADELFDAPAVPFSPLSTQSHSNTSITQSLTQSLGQSQSLNQSLSQSHSNSHSNSSEYIDVSLSKLVLTSSSGPSTTTLDLTPSLAAATADMVAAALAGEGEHKTLYFHFYTSFLFFIYYVLNQCL